MINLNINVLAQVVGLAKFVGQVVSLTYICIFMFVGVFAVIDLYGQCAQVSLTGGSGGHPVDSNIHTRVIETSVFNSPSSGNNIYL